MPPLYCNAKRASSKAIFLASIPGIQSLLNGSSALANHKLLRLDPLLRPLLQLLDSFHTIQFPWRIIIPQWRVFGPENFVHYAPKQTLLRGIPSNVQSPVLLCTGARRECFDEPAEQQVGAFGVRGNGSEAQHRLNKGESGLLDWHVGCHAGANAQEAICFSQLAVFSEDFGPEPAVLKANISIKGSVQRARKEPHTTLWDYWPAAHRPRMCICLSS